MLNTKAALPYKEKKNVVTAWREIQNSFLNSSIKKINGSQSLHLTVVYEV